MKTEKSLEEVRAWKQQIYEKDKNLSTEEIIKKTQRETADLKRSLNLRVVRPAVLTDAR